MKPTVRLIFLTILCLGINVFHAFAQPGTTMYINGRNLYSAAGEKVILRGVNEMMIWSNDQQGKTILPKIEPSKANSVRLAWLTSGSVVNMDSLIGNCIKNKMIPIIELHDATGDFTKIQACLNYWKRADVVAVLNKYKKWVLINIANEPGNETVTNLQFRTTYIDAVAQLRSVGYTMPLIIDAPEWGKNENAITSEWNNILQSDPQKNCIFSLHTYWTQSAASQQTRFTNLFNNVVANNIPFIIGEGPQPFGSDCSSPVPYVWLLERLQTLQIGWLAWSWGAVENGPCATPQAFDISNGGTNGVWQNDWGRLVASDDPNSIKNTSIRPPSILGTLPPDTQAPAVPTGLVVSNVTSKAAQLTWTAATDNIGVTGYDIYAGTTLAGSTLGTTFALTGLTCATAYTFTVKAKDAAGNISVSSAGANATTLLCDSQAPTVPTNLVVSNLSPTSLKISWAASTDNVGVATYQIYRGATLVNANVTGTSYNMTNLSCVTAYSFSVKATDAAGNVSAASSPLSVTTPACPTGEVVYGDALAANWGNWSWNTAAVFNNTTAIEGGSSIKADYASFGGLSLRRSTALAPPANGFIKFWIYSTGANSLNVYTQATDSGPASTQVIFTTIANQWKEIAVSMAALGNPAAIQRINIQNNASASITAFVDYIRFDAPDAQPPTAPTALTVSNLTQTGLKLSWTASTDNVAVTGYQIYQGTTLLADNVAATNYTISNLVCASAYSFTVKAKDAAGNISTGTSINATTNACPDTQAPTVPVGLVATNVTQSGLTLSWATSTDNVGVTGYDIYKAGILLISGITTTTTNISSLTCGTAYSFTVKAKDAAGNVSAASAAGNVTTAACPVTEIAVYKDAIGTDWQNWSWSTVTDFNNTAQIQSGSKSVKADINSWGGLSFRKGTAIATNSEMKIRFWVWSTGNYSMGLYTNPNDDGNDGPDFLFNTTANTWKEFVVSMNQIGSPALIKRLNFQNHSGTAATVYFDEIRITTPTNGARLAATEELTGTVKSENENIQISPNPSSGVVRVKYVSKTAGTLQVQVLNTQGVALQKQKQPLKPGNNSFEIDINNPVSGLYLIRLTAPDGLESIKKVVVRK